MLPLVPAYPIVLNVAPLLCRCPPPCLSLCHFPNLVTLPSSLQDPEEEEEDADTAAADTTVRPERPQRLSKLLLLAMFAYAASHLDPAELEAAGAGCADDVDLDQDQDHQPNHSGNGADNDAWVGAGAGEGHRDRDPANEYARRARGILDAVYHESRSSTVQALVLLGVREFGIGECRFCGVFGVVCGVEARLIGDVCVCVVVGSLEEGWLHIGASRVLSVY